MDYQRIYNQLIERAQSENRVKSIEFYFEAHHIIPKCMGGEGLERQWRTHPNVVLLTAREHFVAHLLLCRIFPTELKLSQALWFFITMGDNIKPKHKVTARMYQEIKEKHASAVSANFKNIPKTKEQIAKSRATRKALGFKPSTDHMQNPESITKRSIKRMVSVKQSTLDGDLVQVWPSLGDIQRSLGISRNRISNCLTGRNRTAGGFIWEYAK